MAEDIVNFFFDRVAPSFSFLTPGAGTQFQAELSSAGAQNTRGLKNLRFRLKSPFILETVRDRPVIIMER